MGFYNITFSPTGGTLAAANALAEALSGECYSGEYYSGEYCSLDITNRKTDYTAYSFQEEDLCIIAVPSFGGRVPKLAAERLSLLSGNGAKAILVAVYGNRAFEDTLIELQDIAEAAGFQVVCGVAAIAQHSIVNSVGAGRPDEADMAHVRDFARQLLADRSVFPLKLPGNRPYRTYNPLPIEIFTKEEQCSKCGLCAKNCPAGAIDEQSVWKLPDKSCIYCMRCVAKCPAKAKYVKPETLEVLKDKLAKTASERKEWEFFIK